MPLRDHFRPPVEDQHSWDELHGMWPAVIVQQLFPLLPEGYVAAPRVHLGTAFEIDVTTYRRDEPARREGPPEANGGIATAAWRLRNRPSRSRPNCPTRMSTRFGSTTRPWSATGRGDRDRQPFQQGPPREPAGLRRQGRRVAPARRLCIDRGHRHHPPFQSLRRPPGVHRPKRSDARPGASRALCGHRPGKPEHSWTAIDGYLVRPDGSRPTAADSSDPAGPRPGCLARSGTQL